MWVSRHLRIVVLLLPVALAAQESGPRFPFFGDLHVHTAWSLDSYVNFNRVGPRDAYRFALGEPVTLSGGRVARIDRPLDFAAVTEHAEYLGELRMCTDETDARYALDICRDIRNEAGQQSLIDRIYKELIIRDVLSPNPQRESDLCGADDARCLARAKSVWRELRDIAAEFNRPGRFTTFVGYEWTGNTNGNNLHRNIIYGNDRVPALPISYFEANTPEKLWRQLQDTCAPPCEVLAIPHNSNQSNGRQFPAMEAGGSPLRAEWAALRAKTEPLVEIIQAKGESECHTGVGTVDELCRYEKIERRPLCGEQGAGEDCVPVCTGHSSGPGCVAPNNYLRNALKTGLELEQELGVNPYRLGFIGSTDTHNGAPGAVDESDFQGHHGVEDGTPEQRARMPEIKEFTANRVKGSGGLTGLWAEQNTRAALFDALQRREAFATSGTRITLRFFAGWEFPDDINGIDDPAALGYAYGTPMGGELPPAHDGAQPGFIIWAMKDPQGVKLQRVQVIKGWLEQGGGTKEQVYDVVCAGDLTPDPATRRCPDNGARVDLSDCSVDMRKGAVELKTLWRDPEFNPRQPAFYYLRVLENPSCRWTTWEALRAGRQPFPDISATIQERAWSSPIWYNP